MMAGPPSTLLVLLHLSAFAQLGVLSRIVIGKLFSGACSVAGNWSWAPCVTGSGLLQLGGALFYDFPANVAGSFLIGLFSTGSTLASSYLHVHTPENYRNLQLLFVPRGSSLQSHVALHFGLRTGYCGSLTTFSSWMLQVVVLMVGRSPTPGGYRGTQWVAALWAIFLGAAGPLLALVMGQHAALAAADALEAAAACRAQRRQQSKHQRALEPVHAASAAAGGGAGCVALTCAPREEIGAGSGGGGGGGAAVGAAGGAGSHLAPAALRGGVRNVASGGGADVAIPVGAEAEPPLTALSVSAAVTATPVPLPHDGSPASASAVASASAPVIATPTCPHSPVPPARAASPSLAPTAAAATAPSVPAAAPSLPPPVTSPARYSPACRAVDTAAAAVVLTLTGVSAAYAWHDRSGPPASARRFWWLSILLGPPGCVARWYLARYNATPARWRARGGSAAGGGGGGWSWLQLGTLTANLSACCLNYAAQALLFRLGAARGGGGGGGGPGGEAALSGTQRVVLQGLMVGTAGCLSTVSTWVVELEVLARSRPAAAYKYAATSVVSAVALGLLVYGIPAWTAAAN